MRALAKRAARALFGDYGIYQVWQSPEPVAVELPAGLSVRAVDGDDLARSQDAELRSSRSYAGNESRLYALFEGERMLCLACCWWGRRYISRHSWPLPANAAKLVHLVTVEDARGRGLAPLLIRCVCAAMASTGHSPLFARIWHSNTPSQHAFSHAGWAQIGWLVQLELLRGRGPLRLAWRVRQARGNRPGH